MADPTDHVDPVRTSQFFLGGWLGAQIVAVIVLGLLVAAGVDTDPTPFLATAAVLAVVWAVQLAATCAASRRVGTGDVRRDFGLRFAPIDVIGIPLGVAAQFALLRAVYFPLQQIWPDTFSTEALERNANDLVDRATGASIIVLFVAVALGAPIVEEIVYRGLLQRPWTQRATGDRRATVVVVVAVAAVFAALHFRPVEFPGLFAFGLVVGVATAVTDRVGLAVVTHVAFNTTALLLVV